MKFERVSLSNFKCYADADVALDRGVTVIHGLNGSGKSTLLEACFFALYGARALDRTLDEVVTTGADETSVELDFTHDGGEYALRRRVRVSGERAQTAECVLDTPEGSIDGATDVRAHVADLLRMDAEAFLNCAYVRQGEVNKLINATPGERQDMIDELLQLGRLEEYRERAHDAVLGVEDVLGEARGELEGVREQIADKEAEDLHERLNAARTELSEVEEERERFRENREDARETLEEAEAVIEESSERRERLDDLDEEIDELEDAIAETEREREDLATAVEERREERATHRERADDLAGNLGVDAGADAVEAAVAETEERIDAVREEIQAAQLDVQEAESDAEAAVERAEDLEARAERKRESAREREESAADATETVEERRERLDDIEERIEARRETLADAPVGPDALDERRESLQADLEDAREREADVRAALETARERVAEAEDLLDAGKCPECGQPVEGSPHVDALGERRERVEELAADLAEVEAEREDLEDRIDRVEELLEVRRERDALLENRASVEQLLDEAEASAEDAREEAERLREEADDHEDEAAEAREEAQDARERAAAARERIGELNGDNADLRERLDALNDLADALDAAATLSEGIESLREKRSMYADRNDERRERLATLREERRDLRDAVDEERLAEARADRERAREYLSDVEDHLADLDERRDDLLGTVNRVEAELDELESLRERRDRVAERVDALDSLREEASDLEAMYGDLRAELRRRNVDQLERMLNDTFELVYDNDSYSRIELSDTYELTVYQKDGRALDPEQLSGGERALFNLSLRCAVYRLIAEGIDGAAPMPPLILDEPTVFLDAGHVSRLVELVESMRKKGVEQILVVSHDDELVGAADTVVRVEKDATTNRSRVERAATPLADD